MKITLNGQEKILSAPTSLSQLIAQTVKNPSHVIAELNGKILTSSLWPGVHIQDGDVLELVTFVGGG